MLCMNNQKEMRVYRNFEELKILKQIMALEILLAVCFMATITAEAVVHIAMDAA